MDADRYQWLQVDLGSRKKVVAVATQGRYSSADWTRRYRLLYSDTGKNWRPFLQDGNIWVSPRPPRHRRRAASVCADVVGEGDEGSFPGGLGEAAVISFSTRGVINGPSSNDSVRNWLPAVASLSSLC